MCLAYPGKIVSIQGDKALVDFGGIQRETNISFVDVKSGDYVIVHAGFAIQKLTQQEAWQAIKIYAQTK